MIAGAGTVGLEIVEDLPSVELIVAAVGGGGLISGIALAAPGVGVVGAENAASTPFTHSLAAGRIVTIEVGQTIADGPSATSIPPHPRSTSFVSMPSRSSLSRRRRRLKRRA